VTAARTARHLAEPLANGSTLRREFRPYRYQEYSSRYRRDLADAIRAGIGDEEDSWDLPEPATSKRATDRRMADRYVKPCGTNAAYQRHLQHGEQPCEPCCEAHKAKLREDYQAKYQRRTDEVPKGRVDVAERLAALAAMNLHTGFESVPPPGYITAGEAARRLGVHVRTVERYVKRIREAA
jgi:hypothetical protein